MVAKFWGKESTDTETWIAATEVLLPQVACQFLASGQDRVTPWVKSNAARTFFKARARDPKATFADATTVHKRVPWDDFPWAGDTIQVAFDVLEGYAFNMKTDV